LYERAGEFRKAADFLKHKKGMEKRVIDLYEQAGDFRAAAEFAKSHEMPEEAKEFSLRYLDKEAADTSSPKHVLEYRARFARKMGLEEEAQQLFLGAMAYSEEQMRYDDAKKLAAEAGIQDREEFYRGLESLFNK